MFNPAWIYFIGVAGLPLIWRGKAAYLLFIPTIAGFTLLTAPLGDYDVFSFLGQKIILTRIDLLSRLFGTIFIIMSFIGILYGLHEKERTEHWVAALAYAGGAMGVVFAGDYITIFIFSELMAFSSVFLIWQQRDEASLAAGFRYIMVHLLGGLSLLGGIIVRFIETGNIAFTAFDPSSPWGVGAAMILFGFLVNAAVPPLSAWLSDAYPEATVTGAVFLSAFTTKTAVYTLIRGFPGIEILVWLGAVMAIYGVIYAVLENDIRRLLAYHIISQVGYMVAGVGMGTEMALNGAGAHAFSHILYKGLLFMGAGAVIHMTGRRKLTDLGGLYRFMPVTLTLYMIGAFSISAFPLFSGFVSKSMIVSAAQESHRIAIWLMLTLASAGTFLHTGLKLPYYTFFGKNSEIVTGEPPINMLLAMGLAAFLCVAIGLFPRMLYGLLPYPVDFKPYTALHVVGSLQMLLFTGLGFMLLLKWLDPEKTVSVDTDWFYRKAFYHAGRRTVWVVAYLDTLWSEAYRSGFILIKWMAGWLWKFDVHIIDGFVNGVALSIRACSSQLRKSQTGRLQHYALVMAMGIFLMLTVYLIFSMGR